MFICAYLILQVEQPAQQPAQQPAHEEQLRYEALSGSSIHDVAQKASVRAPTRHRATRSKDTQAAITATLQTFNNLPEHLQDNEYIRTGYRGLLPVKDAFRSIWRVHTETGNVWSHLIGEVRVVVAGVGAVDPPAGLASRACPGSFLLASCRARDPCLLREPYALAQ